MKQAYAIEVYELIDGAAPFTLSLLGDSDSTEPQTDEGFSEQIAHVKKRLQIAGWDGEPVALLVPSSWCWAATISLDGLPRQQRRDAMRYRFEQHLPVAIELVACDFIPIGKNALGIGLDINKARDLTDTLERGGVPIQWVCPAAILDAAAVLESDPGPAGKAQLLLKQKTSIDLIQSDGGLITHWRSFRGNASDVRPFLSQNTEFSIQYIDPAIRTELPNGSSAAAMDQQSLPPRVERVTAFITAIVKGVKRAPINLRRDRMTISDPIRMIRRPLQAAAASIALLILIASFAMFFRTQRLHQLAEENQLRQQQIFQEVFPGAPAPLLIRPRLESEQQRLRALSGTSSDLPMPPDALADLHAVLVRLPDQLRYRTLDIRIEENEIFIDGEARSHSDTDAIAIGLRDRQGFEIQPPRIERLRGQNGVRFTLSGVAVKNNRQHLPTTDRGSAADPADPLLTSTNSGGDQP